MNRLIFVVAFVVGVAGLTAGYLNWGPYIGASLCVLAMTAYLVWIIATKPQGDAALDLADSFYYLGFLLTLFALALSLVQISGNTDVTVNTVVFRFGVG